MNTANMLLEAADMIETHGNETSSRRTVAQYESDQSNPSSCQAPAVSHPSMQPSRMSFPAISSPSLELHSLFNWKRKSKGRASGGGPSKKPKVHTWTHTWVCLGHMSDDTVPDASERATLKLAGLGERRFAVDVTLTAQELMYQLEAQFPKLVESGGFELLRAEEGGSKELQSIEMPAGGYTCEYLKAVVHSAKVYIRPLQADLNMDPCAPEVK